MDINYIEGIKLLGVHVNTDMRWSVSSGFSSTRYLVLFLLENLVNQSLGNCLLRLDLWSTT